MKSVDPIKKETANKAKERELSKKTKKKSKHHHHHRKGKTNSKKTQQAVQPTPQLP